MAHTVLYLERTIDASHVIPGHPGKCGRLHGHTYRFEVWISGDVAETGDGMLVDFYDVKREIDAWDHRHLNDEVDFVPTAELLAAEMQRRLLALVAERGASAEAGAGVLVRLWETPTAYAQVGYLVPDPGAVGAGALADVIAPG
jgi:6-pyruvoyltetrahydropterin/6-carboxytetrahydropterin synthase